MRHRDHDSCSRHKTALQFKRARSLVFVRELVEVGDAEVISSTALAACTHIALMSAFCIAFLSTIP